VNITFEGIPPHMMPHIMGMQPNRKSITLRLRFEIFKRDMFICQYCGRRAPDAELQVDHVYPKALGGTDDDDNLITSCFECNMGKGDYVLMRCGKVQRQRWDIDRLSLIRSALEEQFTFEYLLGSEHQKRGDKKASIEEVTAEWVRRANENPNRYRLWKNGKGLSIVPNAEIIAEYLQCA
jgi:hypothetical protein